MRTSDGRPSAYISFLTPPILVYLMARWPPSTLKREFDNMVAPTPRAIKPTRPLPAAPPPGIPPPKPPCPRCCIARCSRCMYSRGSCAILTARSRAEVIVMANGNQKSMESRTSSVAVEQTATATDADMTFVSACLAEVDQAEELVITCRVAKNRNHGRPPQQPFRGPLFDLPTAPLLVASFQPLSTLQPWRPEDRRKSSSGTSHSVSSAACAQCAGVATR